MIWVYTQEKERIFARQTIKTMENAEKKRGGKREGAGRKPTGLTTTPMSLKLDNDLYEALKSNGLNKNRYINNAIRSALKKDKLL